MTVALNHVVVKPAGKSELAHPAESATVDPLDP
jgi:hypothetical protein